MDEATETISQAARWSNLAENLITEGKYEEAERWAAKSLKVLPWNPAALNNLAVARLQNGRIQAALEAVNDAIQSDPGRYESWCNRGSIHHRLAEPSKAITDYTQAIRLDPGLPGPYVGRAQALAETGQLAAAEADLAAAERITPDSPAIRQIRAEYHRLAGRHTQALAAVELCLSQNWETPMLRFTQAISLNQLDRPAEAEQCLDRALELDPTFVQAYQERATLRLLNRKISAAINDYRKSIDHHHTRTQACFSFIGLSIAVHAMGRFDDAQQCLDRAQENTAEPALLQQIAELRATLTREAAARQLRKEEPPA